MSQLGRVRAGGGVHERVGGAIFLSVCFFGALSSRAAAPSHQ